MRERGFWDWERADSVTRRMNKSLIIIAVVILVQLVLARDPKPVREKTLSGKPSIQTTREVEDIPLSVV